MKIREEFVLNGLEGGANKSELCREYGISRKTGYKWLQRFRELGIEGLRDMSRRPHSSPLRASGEAVLVVLELRHRHPRWGPKKLRRLLERRAEGEEVPSERTIARILTRAGEVRQARPRPSGSAVDQAPHVQVAAPNDLWTADFKGWWRSQDGMRCEPLTVRDGCSRYLLCAELVKSTKGGPIRAHFEDLFDRCGLPLAIQVDNGPPFASTSSRGGLTSLSAWWVSLGIQLVRGRPGKPQDNASHERMHVDLRFDVEDHAAPTVEEQQAALTVWRHEFNHVRPHEAIGLRVPAELYRRSPRPYRGTRPIAYPDYCHTRKVDLGGHISFKGSKAMLSRSLRGHQVGLEPLGQGLYRVHFYEMDLGEIKLEA